MTEAEQRIREILEGYASVVHRYGIRDFDLDQATKEIMELQGGLRIELAKEETMKYGTVFELTAMNGDNWSGVTFQHELKDEGFFAKLLNATKKINKHHKQLKSNKEG